MRRLQLHGDFLSIDLLDFFRGEVLADAGERAQARRCRGFGGTLEEPLQADAYAQEPRAFGDAFADGFGEAKRGEQLRRLKVANAGQHNFVRAAHDIGRLRDDNIARDPLSLSR